MISLHPDAYPALAEILTRLAASGPDWHGYVHEHPNLLAFRNAALVLHSFRGSVVPLPDGLVATGDGGVGFAWCRDSWHLEIECSNDGEVLLYHRLRHDPNTYVTLDPDALTGASWVAFKLYEGLP